MPGLFAKCPARLLLVGLLCVVSPVLAQEKPSFSQVETIPERDLALFKKLDKAQAANKLDEVSVIIVELLSRSRGENRNLVVAMDGSDEKPSTLFRGYRDLVLARLLELPRELRDSISRGHDAAVRGVLRRLGDKELSEEILTEIVSNYPLALRARDAAERLAELAFERDDLVAALDYDGFVERFHPQGKMAWSTRARRCLTAARSGRVAAARSQLRIFRARVAETGREDLGRFVEETSRALDLILARAARADEKHSPLPRKLALKNPEDDDARIVFWKADAAKPEERGRRQGVIILRGRSRVERSAVEPPRFRPFVRGDDVYVSNGRRVFVNSAKTGRRRAILPFHLGETIEQAPPRGMETGGAGYGALLLANLYIPRSSPSLARSRVLYGQGFGNNYGSLFLFDARRGHKIVFWEGDRGPTGTASPEAPEPAEQGKRSLASVMANGHILGRPALCGQRLYAALLVSDGEPEIWVAAFARGGRLGNDIGLGLRPLWATYIGSAPGSEANSAIPRVFPAVYLSGSQVYCQTGTATVAAVGARHGHMKWIVHSVEPRKSEPLNPRGPFVRPRITTVMPAPSIEPLRFIERPGLSELVIVAPPGKPELTAFDGRTGAIAWTTRRQRSAAHRFFVTREGIVLRYGGRELIAIDGRTGKLCSMPVRDTFGDHKHLPSSDAVTFQGDLEDGKLLVPTGGGRVRVISYTVREVGEYKSYVVDFKLGPSCKLVGTKDDGHIAFTPRGVAMATRERLLIYGPAKH